MDTTLEIDFFRKNPFAVRLTEQEKEFVNENYDELFDGDRKIQPRKAFIMLCEKALYNIHKIKASNPADTTRIGELETELTTLKAKHTEISAQFNDLVNIKLRLEKELDEAKSLIAQLQENPVSTEPQIVEKERELQPTERLLQLTPVESFCLAQIEKVHNCTAKDILINRFFMVYMRRGNGDFDIKRISPNSLKQIEDHFKAQK